METTMAPRGSTKARSVEQENYIARIYGGKRSASSGAADNDAGDVRASQVLIECKMTGGPERERSLPKFVRDFEKIADEAYAEGREPVLALRFYCPDSILSDPLGWIDLSVRLSESDSLREVYWADSMEHPYAD